MGGYVTQSRKTDPSILETWSRVWRNSDGTLESEWINQFPASNIVSNQVTNSYRTRGGDLEADTIFRGGTLGSSYGAIVTYDAESGFRGDNGHEFDTVKSEFTCTHPYHVLGTSPQGLFRTVRYEGPLVPRDASFTTPIVNVPGDLNALGTKAIATVTPGNSPADVALMLIELKRERLPRLFGAASLQNRAQIARSAGDEYLNLEFGWRPLVNDIVQTALAVSESERILSDLISRSGTDIRRRIDYDPVVTNSYQQGTGGATISLFTGNTSAPNNWYIPSQSQWFTHTRTTRSVSFAGAFTYHVPPEILTDSMRGVLERANYLLGLELTPELVWNAAPWSWLTDWVFNIGDVVRNLSNFQVDGTVMRYGYIMSTTDTVKTISYWPKKTAVMPNQMPVILSATYRTIRKTRRRATPFGFGLNPGTFTSRQWAILAALGMTRGNNSLRLSE